MEQPLLSRILAKIGIAILAVALADLLFVNYWLIKTENLKGEPVSENGIQLSRVIDPKSESSPLSLPSSSPSPTKSSSAQPSPIVKTETVIEKQTQTIIQTAQKELFIPIGSGFTKSNSYEDLAGLEVTIDTSKYSAIDSIVFEASLWVEDGNGKMYAQLYNWTDKHPVWLSEITTVSAKGILTTSQKINLEKGSRVYKIQAKTDLSNFAAHVENARIKITLR